MPEQKIITVISIPVAESLMDPGTFIIKSCEECKQLVGASLATIEDIRRAHPDTTPSYLCMACAVSKMSIKELSAVRVPGPRTIREVIRNILKRKSDETPH